MSTSSGNKMVTCPYDNVHKMRESVLQMHIAKCKLNNLDKIKKVCPFNATHLLSVGEYDHHLTDCPDSGVLDRLLAQPIDKNNPFKGRTDVPQFSDPINLDEEWDVDERQTIQLPKPPPGAIIEPRPMAKPAERRRLYKDLHQMPKEADINKEPSPSTEVSAPPRQPKQPSGMQRNLQQTPMIENLGLGRGRPASRIAANFPKEEVSDNVTYSNIVRDMSNLGLGRGSSSIPANQAASSIFDDDDFPALGCGRGTVINQNARNLGARPKHGWSHVG